MTKLPDFSLSRLGSEFVFRARSAAGHVFLERMFAQVEGDLIERDVRWIVSEARILGLVVAD